MERLESLVCTQHEKLDKLEDLVYRVMHRSRVTSNEDNESKSPKYEEDYQGPTRRGTELETLETPHENADPDRKPSVTASFYPTPSI